jgi:DNA-binding transcriptional MerR regulator/methylmalonyl-CoA mutase cobalamin-binding subunit
MSAADLSHGPTATARPALTIAAVERDTRISKDTLRVWERRYGFPQPLRDANGERLYPFEQVERLRHIKRLMDVGHRPGRIVGMTLAELFALDTVGVTEPPPRTEEDARNLQERQFMLETLCSHDVQALRRALGQALLRRGLATFVMDIVVPLLVDVGEAWSRGQVEVFEEHLCSEVVETVLRSALATTTELKLELRPRVLLTTLPFEAHGLALLMAEALFSIEGCLCMNLGTQTPLGEIALAAQAHRADIVALSFSAAVSHHQLVDSLNELRATLAPSVALWAGTSAALSVQRRVGEGVLLLSSLHEIASEIARWRRLRGSA